MHCTRMRQCGLGMKGLLPGELKATDVAHRSRTPREFGACTRRTHDVLHVATALARGHGFDMRTSDDRNALHDLLQDLVIVGWIAVRQRDLHCWMDTQRHLDRSLCRQGFAHEGMGLSSRCGPLLRGALGLRGR